MPLELAVINLKRMNEMGPTTAPLLERAAAIATCSYRIAWALHR